MIIFENHDYQKTTGYPNENYLAGLNCKQPKWVVDDNSELAKKVLSAPCWEPVEDENGNLIDIVPIELPETTRSAEEQTEELKKMLDEIDRQAIRPLRAIAAGTATDEDRNILAELEMQAEEIRAQMAALSDGKEINDGHSNSKDGA